MGHGVVSAARHAGVEHFVQFSVTHPSSNYSEPSGKLEVNGACSCPGCHSPFSSPCTTCRTSMWAKWSLNGSESAVLARPRLDMWTGRRGRGGRKVVGDRTTITPPTNSAVGTSVTPTNSPGSSPMRPSKNHGEAGRTPGPPTPESSRPKRTTTAMTPCSGSSTTTAATASPVIPNVLGWLLGRAPTGFDQYVRRCLVFH